MSSHLSKTNKKSYFYSPKKQALVKKMIFDSNQVNMPSSCYELRPIDQNQSNQQEDIIFDPKSSSLKQISQFQKNSPHELDKMMLQQPEHMNHHNSIFLNIQKQGISSNYAERSQEGLESQNSSSTPLKRQNPTFSEDYKKYQNIVKMFQVDQQNQNKLERQNARALKMTRRRSPYKDIKRISFHNSFSNQKFESFMTPQKQNNKQVCKKNERDSDFDQKGQIQKQFIIQKIQKKSQIDKSSNVYFSNQSLTSDFRQPQTAYSLKQKISYDIQSNKEVNTEIKIEQFKDVIGTKQRFCGKKKIIRKIADNAEFQLINQYAELISYASLIEDLIAIYDESPLFELPLDFDSQQQTDLQIAQQRQCNQRQTETKKKQRVSYQKESSQNTVKIQQNSMNQQIQEIQMDNKIIKSSVLSMFQQMRIDQAPRHQKNKVIKQIRFQKTKTYINFYQPIQELSPYIKNMTYLQKQLLLKLKSQLKQIKQIIEFYQKKKITQKKQHICKICGEQFQSGRQLGGHMSRKHPGKAFQYGFKKQLHKIKQIQRKRRKYFKNQKLEVKIENEENEENE